MSKSLKDMNQTELYKEATDLKIKGRSKLKSKAKRDELISKIIEARKELVYSGDEEMKMDDEGRTIPPKQMEMERESRILEEALNELDEEKSRERMIEEALEQVEEDRAQRRGAYSETPNERMARIVRENQPPPEFVRQQRQMNSLLSPQNLELLKSNFNAENVDKLKTIYKDSEKLISKHGVRDGLIRLGLKYTVPELALLQQASDYLGFGYTDKDHDDLMKTFNEGFTGKTSFDDMKLGFKLVFNPAEWARLGIEEVSAIGENVSTGISDVIRKARGIKKKVVDEEADKAKQVISKRESELKKKIAQEKKLAEIKGEEYTGLSEDDILEDSIKMPRLSDFGGED